MEIFRKGSVEEVNADKISRNKLIVPLCCDWPCGIVFSSQVFFFLIITTILPCRNYSYLYFIDEETVAWRNCFVFLRSHREP